MNQKDTPIFMKRTNLKFYEIVSLLAKGPNAPSTSLGRNKQSARNVSNNKKSSLGNHRKGETICEDYSR